MRHATLTAGCASDRPRGRSSDAGSGSQCSPLHQSRHGRNGCRETCRETMQAGPTSAGSVPSRCSNQFQLGRRPAAKGNNGHRVTRSVDGTETQGRRSARSLQTQRRASRRPDRAVLPLNMGYLARRDAAHPDPSGTDHVQGRSELPARRGRPHQLWALGKVSWVFMRTPVRPTRFSIRGASVLALDESLPVCSCLLDPGMSSDPAPQRFHEMSPISHASGCTDSASTSVSERTDLETDAEQAETREECFMARPWGCLIGGTTGARSRRPTAINSRVHQVRQARLATRPPTHLGRVAWGRPPAGAG